MFKSVEISLIVFVIISTLIVAFPSYGIFNGIFKGGDRQDSATDAGALRNAEAELKVLENYRDVISPLLEKISSKNPIDVSAGMKQMGEIEIPKSRPVAEIYEVIKIKIDSELVKSTQQVNGFIISAAIDLLGDIGSAETLEYLKGISKILSTKHAGHGSSTYFVKNLENASKKLSFQGRPSQSLEKLISSNLRIVNAAKFAAAPESKSESPKAGVESDKTDKSVPPTLTEFLKGGMMGIGKSPIAGAIVEVLTDTVREQISSGKQIKIYGRHKESEQTEDILIRLKGRAPILIGPAGVGKTAVAERMAERIVKKEYPQTEAFRKVMENADVIVTSASMISSLAQSDSTQAQKEAIRKFCDSILDLEREYEKKYNVKKPIILFIDEFHELTKDQVESLLVYLDSKDKGIKVIAATNSDKFDIAHGKNEALMRRVYQVPIEELTPDETFEVLKHSWLSIIEKEYNVVIDDSAIKSAIKLSPKLMPGLNRPDAPFKVLQHVAITANRANVGRSTNISDNDIFAHVTKVTGIPVNPRNGREFENYLDGIKDAVNKVVVDQEEMVGKVVDHYGDQLRSGNNKPKVLTIVGTTGIGKTYLGETLAKKIYNNEKRLLVIDATEYSTGGYSLNTLFGAHNGIISSDTEKGVLMKYLDDPAQGKFGGVILINEAEKAHPDFWKRLMEFFDKGYIRGGDGKLRYSGNHFVMLTSNRGAELVFPPQSKDWTEDEIKRRLDSVTKDDIINSFKNKASYDDKFTLPPEVLGRIDDFLFARPTTIETAKKIAPMTVAGFINKFKEDRGVTLEFSASLINHFAEIGYSKTQGVRPLNRHIESYFNKIQAQINKNYELKEDSKVEVDLVMDKATKTPQILITLDGGTPLSIEAANKKPSNPLKNKKMISRILQVPKVIKDEIFGQEEAVQSVVQSIKSQLVLERDRPLSLYFVGSTGTGKTELGKVIAKALFDNPDRAGIFPLGNVNFEGALNNIFSPPAGYVGSDRTQGFEQYLIANPDGGVIIWDEASNMGGHSKERKHALFKEFYDITDRGVWVSPSSKKEYDLTKYIFIFTGNDSESLFMGITSDELRLAKFREYRDKGKLRELLTEAGIPQAFLGRMADIILFKPLIKAEIIQITEKLLNVQIKKITEKNPNIKITYSKDFTSDLATAFFSQDMGGRSVRAILDERLNPLIGTILVENGYDPDLEEKVELRLSFSGASKGKTYSTAKSNASSIKMVVDLKFNDGRTAKTDMDISDSAPKKILMPAESALITAYHEVGHALVNDPKMTGIKLSHFTIVGGKASGKEYLGYASYVPDPRYQKNPTKTGVLWMVAQLRAGAIAQQMAGYEPDAGQVNDLERANELIDKALLKWGLEPELFGIKLNKDGSPSKSSGKYRLYERKSAEFMSKADDLAKDILAKNWTTVRRLVAEVVKKGYIYEAKVNEIKAETAILEKRFGKMTYDDYKKYTKPYARMQYKTGTNKCIYFYNGE